MPLVTRPAPSFVRHALAAAALLTATAAGGATPLPQYAITDLGLVQSSDTTVAGLNRLGQVVGVVHLGDDPTCVVYDHGARTYLGNLGGTNCFVSGINDVDTVVGSSSPAVGSVDVHAFVYQNGTMTDLGTRPGDTSSVATAVNNHGLVVGTSSSVRGSSVWTWRDGIYRRIPMPAGAVTAAAGGVNDRGQITGWATYETDHPRAFLYADGQAVDLGTLDDAAYNSQSQGLAVNDAGQVVGWSSGPSFFCHAMLSSHGTMVDLGALPAGDAGASSVATSINGRGQIVGTSEDSAGNQVAFISDGRHMVDLNTRLAPESRGWQLLTAQGINRSGQITGLAWSTADQQLHVFLATPDR